jgi:hypothetical protein
MKRRRNEVKKMSNSRFDSVAEGKRKKEKKRKRKRQGYNPVHIVS